MTRKASFRPGRGRFMLAICGVLALSACAAKYAQMPARLDLHPYGRVAVARFTVERADTDMSVLATERFAEELLASQGIELFEVASADSLPTGVEVPAIFLGHLTLSDLKPQGSIGRSGVNLRGAVKAELSVRLVSTETGGTLWRSSAATEGTVGRVRLGGGIPTVDVRDQHDAYGELVQSLVAHVTRDLRPTWVRQ